MVNPLKPFSTPEYLFRPRQIVVRIKRQFVRPANVTETVRLPWGTPFRIRPSEVIGANIWYYGIFELVVAETIARLMDHGETAVDIGANVGQMTTLMRKLAGKDGRVIAFEPHPELFAELCANMELASGQPGTSPVEPHDVGLSDTHGAAFLDPGPEWQNNRGMSRVRMAAPDGGPGLKIELHTFDELLPPGQNYHVCKIDVEGHELQVLRGAAKTLSAGGIRDLIFEDLSSHNSPLQDLLRAHGFAIFALQRRLLGPVLYPPEERELREKDGDTPYNFLATRDAQRALARFGARGWQCLNL